MYYAKELETIVQPGGWKYVRVGIFQDKDQIGEYTRHYGSYAEKTFHPFRKDDRWYALYSENYTCTYLMSLPDCKKIGGEEGASNGFCPVDLWVPQYKTFKDEEFSCRIYENEKGFDKTIGDKKYSEETYYDLELGFIAGCIWGDDCSWKIQRLDLTECDKGIIKRAADFGYIEMFNSTLKESINIDDYGDDEQTNISFASIKRASWDHNKVEIHDD